MRYFILSIFLLSFTISYSQLTVIEAFSTPTCIGSCNGVASVQANGGTPPYVYNWGGMSTAPDVWGLCFGFYTVVVTDGVGDTASATIFITDIPPISATIVTTDDTCGMCNGTAAVTNINGGAGSYTYSWNTAPPQNTPSATNLCAGTYSCTIVDAGGCIGQFMATVNLTTGGSGSCQYGVVSGKVYNDFNTNCNQDTLENGLANIIIEANPGPFYASTNANGEYSMLLPFDNYTITQILPVNFNEICPVAGSYAMALDSLNNTFANIDFADSITPVQDVSIQLTSSTARPGFYYTYYLNYSSLNSVPMNGMISLVFDASILTYSLSSIAPDVISGDTLFWNYSNLQLFENRGISASFYVPADVNLLGDNLSACSQITPLIGDVNLINNSVCHDRIIVGSYDPNDKQVSPKGVGVSGEILPTETELTYTIRFQNSGTDTAFNVVVVDTLSANLNVASLRKVMASHPFTYGLSGEGVLTFTFNNILLPDSNVNEPASHGLIEFTIDQKPSNIVGTEIKNTAEIYFDFNPAIFTNSVINTVSLLTNVTENRVVNGISIYPNPAKDKITLDFSLTSTKEVTIEVFDLVGKKVTQLVQQKLSEGNHKILLEVNQMHSGIYFMSFRIGEENYLRKIVIQ